MDQREIIKNFLKKAGAKGGKKKWSNFTEEQKAAYIQKMNKARLEKMKKTVTVEEETT